MRWFAVFTGNNMPYKIESRALNTSFDTAINHAHNETRVDHQPCASECFKPLTVNFAWITTFSRCLASPNGFLLRLACGGKINDYLKMESQTTGISVCIRNSSSVNFRIAFAFPSVLSSGPFYSGKQFSPLKPDRRC